MGSVIQKHVGAVALARLLQFRNENTAFSFRNYALKSSGHPNPQPTHYCTRTAAHYNKLRGEWPSHCNLRATGRCAKPRSGGADLASSQPHIGVCWRFSRGDVTVFHVFRNSRVSRRTCSRGIFQFCRHGETAAGRRLVCVLFCSLNRF